MKVLSIYSFIYWLFSIEIAEGLLNVLNKDRHYEQIKEVLASFNIVEDTLEAV